MKPTIEDVARAAGVSRATVSRVINGEPGASPPLRARVNEVIEQLGYSPNYTARALASGRPPAIDLIAVMYSDPLGWLGVHPYYSRVLAGITSVLESSDLQLRLQSVGQADAAEAMDRIARHATVGAILTNVGPDLAARFHRRCPRAVSMVTTAPSVPAMEVDNQAGAVTAIEELHRLGRRRIAAIHGPAASTCAVDRRAGYLQAIDALGLPDLGLDGGDFLLEHGHRAALELVERHPDLDAVFVACDLMAAGAVQALTATGRKIPDDVAVIGFDDSIAAACTNPPLTTMRVPVEEMAATATRLLLTGATPPALRQQFPVTLVRRSSV